MNTFSKRHRNQKVMAFAAAMIFFSGCQKKTPPPTTQFAKMRHELVLETLADRENEFRLARARRVEQLHNLERKHQKSNFPLQLAAAKHCLGSFKSQKIQTGSTGEKLPDNTTLGRTPVPVTNLYPVRQNARFGFINAAGEIVVPLCFDNVRRFSNGMAAVNIGGYWHKTIDGPDDDDFQSKFIGGKWGFINAQGEITVDIKFNDVGYFKEGSAWVKSSATDAPNTSKKKQSYQYGFVTFNGQFLTESKYDGATDFSQGAAGVAVGNRWGYINTQGKLIIVPRYLSVTPFSNQVAAVKFRTAQIQNTSEYRPNWIYIDKMGNKLVLGAFYFAKPFHENVAPVCTELRFDDHKKEMVVKWGLIHKSGHFVLEPTVDYIGDYGDGRFVVEKNHRAFVIDIQGNKQFDVKDHTGRLINVEPVSPGIRSRGLQEEVLEFKSGMAPIRIHGEEIHLNIDGDGHGFYFWGGKWGFIDYSGSVVIQPAYDDVRPFSEGLAAVQIEDKWGFINLKNEMVIPLRFDYVHPFSEGLAYVELEDLSAIDKLAVGYIDKTGQPIWKPTH